MFENPYIYKRSPQRSETWKKIVDVLNKCASPQFNLDHRAMYSTASDPQPQMIPRPQMIPNMDRKWSSTASDPQSWPQMIPKEK